MKKLLLSPVWSVIVLALMTWIYWANPSFLESLRLRYFDTLIVNQEPINNNIYTVNIDEAGLKAQGQWPWPRGDYASLIEDLYDRGAGLVVFNVLMSEADRMGQDAEMRRVLSEYPVIVTMLGAEENKNDPINPGATVINSEYINLIPSVDGVVANVFDVEHRAIGSGIVNTFPEVDGVTRRAPLVLESSGTLYPNVTMEILRVLAGDPSFQIKLNALGVDKLRIPQYGFIQTNSAGEVWIDWSQQSQSVSVTDMPADFEGAVVFVGPTAAGITQPIATATGSVFPHELQAAMLGTVFNKSNIVRHPDAEAWGEITALVVGGILLILLARWTWAGIVFYVMSVGLYIGGSIYVFNAHNWLVDGFTVGAMLLIVGMVRYVIKFADEFLQKQAIKKQFAGYASPAVVKLLQEDPDLVKQGTKREVSIVFSDLRGFTPLGESFGDDVAGLTKIMNGYMDAITEPVLDNHGMIIKYIGDASMHIHNAPVDDAQHAHTAVRTGLQMLKAVEKFNREVIVPQQRPPVAVSTAARIESKCKDYGCLLLVGESTYAQTQNDFFYLKVDDLQVKGKTVGLGIYTVLDDAKPAWKTAKKYHDQMHNLYRAKQFDSAIKQCKLISNNFDGKMRDYYNMWIKRCEYMKTQDLPDDWNGTFVAQSK